MITSSSSCGAVRNALGTSITATYRPWVALIDAVIKTDSVATVGEVASALTEFLRCFWPSATVCPFILPQVFFLQKNNPVQSIHLLLPC